MRTRILILIPTLLSSAIMPLRAQTLEDARTLHREGNLQAALEAYARIAAESLATDPVAAATAHNNACVILNDFADYETARSECEHALQLRRQLGDDRGLGRTLNNLAIAQQNLGEYAAAGARFGEALAINSQRGDVRAQVLNLSNLGTLAILTGSYGKALEFYELAIGLATGHAEEPWAEEQLWIAAINRGVVLERLGAFREALELYRGLAEESTARGDVRRRAQLKLNIGVIYRNLGDPLRAVREFEDVAAIYRRLDDPDGLSNALLNLGLVFHLNLDRFDDAEAAYREALDLAVRYEDRPEEIQDLFYLGQFLLDRRRLEEAHEMFTRCLLRAEESGASEGRWSALAGLGRITAARKEFHRAIEHLEAAMMEIEQVGSTVPTSDLLSNFFGSTRPVYATAIRVLAELDRLEPDGGHDERALEVVQRAKARALLDALGDGEWSSEPLTGAELQLSAGDGLLLEYFAAEGDLLRWIIRPTGVRMDHLGPYAPVVDATREIYTDLSAGSRPEPGRIHELSHVLLSGVDFSASDSPPVYVAADGVLRHLPFELLLPSDDSNGSLIERTEVSYVPSGSMLSWLRKRAAQRHTVDDGPQDVRVFVNSGIDNQHSDTTSPIGLLVSRYNLRPLEATKLEIDALARHLPGRREIFADEEATESALKASPRPVSVLHLAAHAVVDGRPGRGAAILLRPDAMEDGLLQPREIATLEHQIDLTVLAACSTAVELQDSGALSTLAGSFLAAGSSAVMATLWDVGDRATAAFMEQFYYHLGRGLTPSDALRRAKQRLRDDPEWSHPSLWAAYVLIGEAPPLFRPRPSALPWITAGGVVAALLLLVWRRRSMS